MEQPIAKSPRLVACTIVAHNYLPLARVVARSFLDHHPNDRFVVVTIDRPIESRIMPDDGFEILPITDIDFGDEGWEYMATAYDVTEFATSVKPFALRHLVRDADCALYLDPDIQVFASLQPLVDATIAAGWSLTPHCLAPIVRDGTGPTEAEIMAAGVYNLGYIGVTPRATPFLDWWAERLRRDAIIDPARHVFTDQRWIDLAVPIFRPHIEPSPAYNVAYWNADQRPLRKDGDRFMVGDEPLRFFHFSGYDPKKPHWFSKYQPAAPRILMSEQPLIVELCRQYVDFMRACGHDGGPVASYGWAEAFPGLPLKGRIRRRFLEELIEADAEGTPKPPTPFRPGGARRFEDWLRAVPSDSKRGLPRYLDFVWEESPDLQERFRDVAIGDTEPYLDWARGYGAGEHPLITALGPPSPPPVNGNRLERDHDDPPSWNPDGVDVVGYLRAELGVGEAGRQLFSALEAVGVETGAIVCEETTSRQQHPFEPAGPADHETVIFAVNADQLGRIRHLQGARFFEQRYIIGQWFWEVEQFPKEYRGAFAFVHEVWAPTAHIRDSLEGARPKVPIVHMPLPLVAPPVNSALRKADFGLDDRFTFLFTFDLLSVLDRKNPTGVIEAFKLAFTPDEGPLLVLKTINGDQRLQDLEELRWAMRGRRDIVLIDDYFDSGATGALTAACDCYVSLHRSEGLGLTMSEAMTLGKPVIATAYSGNLDFMTDETAYLIPWEPVKIGKDCAPYPPDAIWADPDLHVAAAMMRTVVNEPNAAAAVGERARIDLATRFSPQATGERMSHRLREIWSLRHA